MIGKTYDYETLCADFRRDPAVMTLAMTAVFEGGAAAIREGMSTLSASTMLAPTMADTINQYAEQLANSPLNLILAFIQREMDPVYQAGNPEANVPPLHPHGHEEDVCPICGGSLEYLGDRSLDDEGTSVSWSCKDCKATGIAIYRDEFIEHISIEPNDEEDVTCR